LNTNNNVVLYTQKAGFVRVTITKTKPQGNVCYSTMNLWVELTSL